MGLSFDQSKPDSFMKNSDFNSFPCSDWPEKGSETVLTSGVPGVTRKTRKISDLLHFRNQVGVGQGFYVKSPK